MASKNTIEEEKKIPSISEFSELPSVEQVVPEGLTYKKPEPQIKGTIQVPKPKKEQSFLRDVLFGPDVEYAGTLTGTAGRTLNYISKKVMGEEPELENSYNIIETGTAGIIDGSLKMLKYGFTLTGQIKDALAEDGIEVDAGTAAKLEKYFNESLVGKIQRGAEDIAETDAVGKLTSAFTQLYGGGKLGAAVTLKIAEKAKTISNNFVRAVKVNKVSVPNKNMVNAMQKANQLNKLTRGEKFMAIGIGGGVGAGIVADVEGIGTLGDIDALTELFGGSFPTKIDRIPSENAKDEALRNLTNRFKFGVDTGLISIVAGYGLGKLFSKLRNQGGELAYSSDKLDQWADKFAKQFRPRGGKSQELFENIKKVEGRISASQVTAKDLILDLDKTLLKISKESGVSSGTPAWKRVIGRIDELLTAGDDVVTNGKLTFNGFKDTTIKEFNAFTKEIGLTKPQVNSIISDLFKIRGVFNDFKNGLLNSKNLNVGAKEFNNIMSERMRNLFTSEYKIATDRSILPWNNYKPTKDNIEAVKQVFARYGKDQGRKFTDSELDVIVDDVIKNVRINDLTKSPEFFLTKFSALDDGQTQLMSIADNIIGGKFKPTDLIKTEKELRSFQRLFGQKRDIRNTIINTVEDLSNLVAKDAFYDDIAKISENQIKNGKRSIVYNNRLDALKNFTNQKVIADKNGLQIRSPLGEETYTNPLNGKFTSEDWAKALQFAEELPFSNLAKEAIYRHLVLIPKGFTQVNKTMLNPFTHTRNFMGSSILAIGSGNAFKNPITVLSNFKRAFNTIQPQLVYRNLPKDQAMYKFLLEEGVTNSSITARDLAGILDDIGKGGDVYQKFFGRFGQGMKKIYTAASDLYVSEDDIWKVFTFLGEFDSYTNAYKAALAKGLIKTMPSELSIMKEAANLVRNYMPNYNYVGTFGQGIRRSPFGNFIAWPIEITRGTYNLIDTGIKETQNPIFRELGYKRLASAGITIGIAVPTISEIMRNLYGFTKEKLAAVREFAPFYSKDSVIFAYKDPETGELKMIDATGLFVYDSLTNPVQALIASVEEQRTFKPGQPLAPAIYEGIIRGLGRYMRPFIEPSIWYATMLDILVRDGETKEGYRVWNTEAPFGEKVKKATLYTLENTAPGGFQQFRRLTKAALETPGKRGEKYDLGDELAGFYGLRGIKIDPLKQMDFKINDYKKSVRGSRGLFSGEIGKGGPLEPNFVVERFYIANQQKFKAMKEQKQIVEAAQLLDVDNRDLYQKFKERGEAKDYSFITKNEYNPFDVSRALKKDIKEQREELEENFNVLNLPDEIDRDILRTLNDMKRDMNKIPLDGNFQDYIKLENYLISKQSSSLPTNVAPLPEQPMPNPSVVQAPTQPNIMQSGLTPTEGALLSQEEQMMRLKQRGLA
jgi:hypothetical protein